MRNWKTNKQVFKRRDPSFNRIEPPKSKLVRINADVILDKFNKSTVTIRRIYVWVLDFSWDVIFKIIKVSL